MLSREPPSSPPRREATVRIATPCVFAALRVQSWEPDRETHPDQPRITDALASEVGIVSSTGPWRTLCVGPGDWFVVSSYLSIDSLAAQFSAAVTRPSLAVVDVSQAWKSIEVNGSFARNLLAKGCGLNFDSARFGVKHCARTRFAGIQVIVECRDTVADFQLYVGRSYASFLAEWLLDAAIEFANPPRRAGEIG